MFQSASSGLLAIAFLALPYLYAGDEHIAVDLVHDHLPRTVRLVSAWVVRVVAVVFGLTLGWYALDLVQSASEAGLRTSGAFSLPVSLVSAPMAFGGLLLALIALVTPAPAVDKEPGSGAWSTRPPCSWSSPPCSSRWESRSASTRCGSACSW